MQKWRVNDPLESMIDAGLIKPNAPMRYVGEDDLPELGFDWDEPERPIEVNSDSVWTHIDDTQRI